MKALASIGFGLLTLLPTHSDAASIYRCVDKAGQITLTRQGCPAGQEAQTTRVVNQTPGSGPAIPLAKPTPASKRQVSRGSRELTVVGEQDDGCGNRLTGRARRNALINQQIHAGMTRNDVESAFGKPDRIVNRNGQTQYRYVGREGRSRTVSFDEHGCVRGKP